MKKEIYVDSNINKTSIKSYLEERLKFSSRRIKKLLRGKNIKINNKVAYWDNTIKKGDYIEINLEEKIDESIIPEKIPLEIIFEDDYLLVINKPAYMVMHPTKSVFGGTVANAVVNYFIEKKEKHPVRFLNRLDMNTTGVVVIPKSSEIHSTLSKQMLSNNIKKNYIALVEGNMANNEGEIDAPIGKNDNNIKRIIKTGGQSAITKYKVIKKCKNATLLELELLTGRTHQIRVHMNSIGHPLVGDSLYGDSSIFINRQALHASVMKIKHPVTNKIQIFSANIPEDINTTIEKLQ